MTAEQTILPGLPGSHPWPPAEIAIGEHLQRERAILRRRNDPVQAYLDELQAEASLAAAEQLLDEADDQVDKDNFARAQYLRTWADRTARRG